MSVYRSIMHTQVQVGNANLINRITKLTVHYQQFETVESVNSTTATCSCLTFFLCFAYVCSGQRWAAVGFTVGASETSGVEIIHIT